MKAIVPLDFSDISLNAAEFTAQMLRGKPGATIVLYHVYRNDSEATLAYKNLEWLKESYEYKYEANVECKAELGDNFVNCLSRLARTEEADLLVMAVTERKIVAESFSLQMIAQNICPVLVIPPCFAYKDVQNVAIACDFRNVEQLIPLMPVKKILQILRPALHIVNVSSDNDTALSPDEKFKLKIAALKDMFHEYNPDFHFIRAVGFHDSLRRFIADKQIDLVLTFPRKHSFFNYLLKGTNTRKLVYEAEVPVLAAHE
jgi:nucleotide-binding universal stress UspA family protein